MLERNQLIREVELIPAEYLPEISDFIGYLKSKKLKAIPETMLFSEKSLAKDWDTPEEDEAWANL
ncbi:MAG: DUF2281 domain-containing protein [Oscillospiraceae bacterium]|nr:DUF2281 domain-containing protein [Oscillospiraceae bacterium]